MTSSDAGNDVSKVTVVVMQAMTSSYASDDVSKVTVALYEITVAIYGITIHQNRFSGSKFYEQSIFHDGTL